MNRYDRSPQLVRHIILVSLLGILTIWLHGCASSSRMHKSDKHGQVPCPCEKNSRQ